MKHSRSTLFLLELIIAIFFFSVASTVCIQLFAKSHLLSKQTINENHAVTQTQNLAESFLGSDGNFLEMKKHFPNAEYIDNSLALYFDNDWNSCNVNNAHFVATLDYALTDTNLCTADIAVSTYNSDNPKVLYSIELIHHIKERRGDLE